VEGQRWRWRQLVRPSTISSSTRSLVTTALCHMTVTLGSYTCRATTNSNSSKQLHVKHGGGCFSCCYWLLDKFLASAIYSRNADRNPTPRTYNPGSPPISFIPLLSIPSIHQTDSQLQPPYLPQCLQYPRNSSVGLPLPRTRMAVSTLARPNLNPKSGTRTTLKVSC
jgi:hypothetical protein